MTAAHKTQALRAPMREHRGDFYDTPPCAVHALLEVEPFLQTKRTIWEPACGTGNIVKVLRDAGHSVIATDLNGRGCPDSSSGIDFLMSMFRLPCEGILTNPPYVLARQFVEMALENAPVAIMLLRLGFYESKQRSHILDNGMLARIHVFANRLPLMHRADWQGPKATSSIAFAWYVWSRDHSGPTTIDRIEWKEP
jgi:hypothetical protein